ncbi:hypothetical protein GCM10027610_105270 [Dactylosporangium cerinum]
MVAATSVNLALRTADEQAALIDTFGRWLNSLATPTQIVVSAQPVDLASSARNLARAADRLPDQALAAACTDHAQFLADLAERRDPLRRQVLIVTRAGAGSAASTPPVAAPTTPSAPCPASASPPAHWTATPSPPPSPPPRTRTGRRGRAASPHPTR